MRRSMKTAVTPKKKSIISTTTAAVHLTPTTTRSCTSKMRRKTMRKSLSYRNHPSKITIKSKKKSSRHLCRSSSRSKRGQLLPSQSPLRQSQLIKRRR